MIDAIRTVVFLTSALIAIIYFNCLFCETVKANSANPPPHKFQWSAACDCTERVLKYYRSLL